MTDYTPHALIIDIIVIIILAILFLRVVLWIPPLDAAEYTIAKYIQTEHQYKFPGENDYQWKTLTISKDGKIYIVTYLKRRWGVVDQRYWSKVVDTEGVEHWVDARLVVGE